MKIMEPSLLAKWLQSNAVVVLDSRSAEEFAVGSIKTSINVCTSSLIIRRLKKGNYPIESLLSDDEKAKYEMAKATDAIAVVVYDQQSRSIDQLTEDSVALHLLRRISKECQYAAFLAGGYLEFYKRCRQYCTLPNAKQLNKRPSNLSLQLSTLNLDSSSLSLTETQESDSSPSPSSVGPRETAFPHQILEHLYLGCRKAASTLHKLRELGITHILNVTPVSDQLEHHLESFQYKQIAVEDSHDVNMLQFLPEAFSFIEDARLSGERVLVHCHAGMSRSVTIILAYLMKYYDHTLESAYDFVKQRKPDIQPNFSFMGQLVEFQYRLGRGTDEQLVGSPDSGIGSAASSPMDTCNSSCTTFMSDVPCIMAA